MDTCTPSHHNSEPKDNTDIIDNGSDNGQNDNAITRLDPKDDQQILQRESATEPLAVPQFVLPWHFDLASLDTIFHLIFHSHMPWLIECIVCKKPAHFKHFVYGYQKP